MNNQQAFEEIKKTNDIGQEYWSARELHIALEYIKWDKFVNVINKAKKACENSGQEIADHFPHVEKMVELGSGSKRDIGDIHLSRYACYLIVQNADPSKEVVALGQTYFTVQTRKQEIQEEQYEKLQSEDERRLFLRKEMAEHNKQLIDSDFNIENLNYEISIYSTKHKSTCRINNCLCRRN